MKISVIGTGRMGKGLVGVLNGQVDELLWGSRNPEQAAAFIRKFGYKHVLPVNEEEALSSDIIVPALWFRDFLPWAEAHRKQLAGKIIVDITNPFNEDFSDFTTAWGTSAAEELQNIVPDSRVVGAFKNTFFKVLADPIRDGQFSDVYVTSDDGAAKEKVIAWLTSLPFRILDGGTLSNNRIIERMTLFEREVAIRYGTYPYVAFRMFGLD